MKPLAKRRILLVEDEYMIAMDLKDALERAGAEVLGPVPTVGRALVLLDAHQEHVNAAVLDVNLGNGETSYPIADRLRAIGVPFVFATGEIRFKKETHYPGSPFLEKPVLEADLIDALAALARQA